MKDLLEFLDKYRVSYRVEAGEVIVDGDLYLYNERLTSLPDSFGNLRVGGSLYLGYNQLTSLPDSFGNLKVGGDLYLHNNRLTILRDSFGNLKVGGDLLLGYNQLTSLPDSFGNLKAGGSLYLDNNQLTSLPDSFGNLKAGGSLYLDNNQLTSLPDSFGNLKVGGSLYLDNNQLTSLPVVPRMMSPVIEQDWCFIDGIVREIVSMKSAGDLTVIKTPFDYIVGRGQTWAHGKTLQEAIEDYGFKQIAANPEELRGLDVDKPMSHAEAINVYRAITRACREGVRQWMAGKDLPEPITIREIVELTKGAYGGDAFSAFFEEVSL